MNINILKKLDSKEKRTFYLHASFSIIDGMIRAALWLNEYVFIKSLNGTSYQLSFLFQSSVIVLLLSVLFNELIARAKRKRRMLRRAGFLTHLPLLILLLFPKTPELYIVNSIYHYVFLFVFLTYYLSYPIVLPTINLFLKNVYSKSNFGKLYGISSSIRQIVMMITFLVLGILLDANPFSFTWFFPLLGLLGFFSVVLISWIEFVPKNIPEISEGILESVITSFKKMVNILKVNRAYFDFQIAYMFYGFAFMSTRSVINIFYDKALSLNYSSVAFYQNAYNIIAILLLPVFGRVIGNVDPRRFTIIPFFAMAGYIFFTGMASYIPVHLEIWNIQIYLMLFIATMFYGLFFSTMLLSWNIGSSYFAKNEEAGDYQSIHLFGTGLRGAVSPLIGIVVYELFGFSLTFGIAVFMLLIGIYVLHWSSKKRIVSGS